MTLENRAVPINAFPWICDLFLNSQVVEWQQKGPNNCKSYSFSCLGPKLYDCLLTGWSFVNEVYNTRTVKLLQMYNYLLVCTVRALTAAFVFVNVQNSLVQPRQSCVTATNTKSRTHSATAPTHLGSRIIGGSGQNCRENRLKTARITLELANTWKQSTLHSTSHSLRGKLPTNFKIRIWAVAPKLHSLPHKRQENTINFGRQSARKIPRLWNQNQKIMNFGSFWEAFSCRSTVLRLLNQTTVSSKWQN